jgi:hypothetical protein
MVRAMNDAAPMKRIALLLAVMGCVEPTPTDVPKQPLTGKGGDWDPELQGRHILGDFADTLLANNEHFRVSILSSSPAGWSLSVTTAGVLGANGANLIATNIFGVTHTGADPWFANKQLTMTGPNGRLLRITGAVADGRSTLYDLEIFDPAKGAWSDYCAGEGGAFPLAGGFNERRIHTQGPTITFACKNGVANKCIRWGYTPGTAGAGNMDWDHHQACIQMANAAYCGGAQSGLPFTREETPIVIRDFRANYAMPEPTALPALTHPAVFPGDPDTFYIEAAWRAYGQAPLCVSKLRWKSLPPNPCPLDLPDPRYDNHPEVKYCEEYTFGDLRAMGALLIQGSQAMDMTFERWKNPVTLDVVTTIRGFHSTLAGESVEPFSGYSEYLGTEGMVLRNLTGTLDADVDMIKLYTQHDSVSTRLAVSDDAQLPGYTYVKEPDFEAYAFRDPTRVANLSAIKVCFDGTHYITTTSKNACPAGTIAAPMYAMAAP